MRASPQVILVLATVLSAISTNIAAPIGDAAPYQQATGDDEQKPLARLSDGIAIARKDPQPRASLRDITGSSMRAEPKLPKHDRSIDLGVVFHRMGQKRREREQIKKMRNSRLASDKGPVQGISLTEPGKTEPAFVYTLTSESQEELSPELATEGGLAKPQPPEIIQDPRFLTTLTAAEAMEQKKMQRRMRRAEKKRKQLMAIEEERKQAMAMEEKKEKKKRSHP